MTPREQMTLLKLAVRLAEQGGAPKDASIEHELAALLQARADTPYLLLRRCVTLEMELEEAQTRLSESKLSLSPFGAGSHAVQKVAEYKVPRLGTHSSAPPSGLRDLLGEWASTTLLNELVDEIPPPKSRGRH